MGPGKSACFLGPGPTLSFRRLACHTFKNMFHHPVEVGALGIDRGAGLWQSLRTADRLSLGKLGWKIAAEAAAAGLWQQCRAAEARALITAPPSLQPALSSSGSRVQAPRSASLPRCHAAVRPPPLGSQQS